MDVELFRGIIRDRLDEMGQSPITAAQQAGLPRDAIRSVFRGHPPSLERAAEIASALGLELVIRRRGAVSAPAAASEKPRENVRFSRGFSERSDEAAAADFTGSAPEPAPGAALEPVTDRHIAEAVAVLADEYEALNARGRESLLMRFWATHPDLRERAAARAGRRLARLAGG